MLWDAYKGYFIVKTQEVNVKENPFFLQDFLGLQTFPVFAKKKEIKTRYILLEAYLLTRRYSKIFPRSLSKSCTACYKERIFEYQGRQHSSLDMEAKAAASRTSALYRYSSIICSKLTQDSNFYPPR